MDPEEIAKMLDDGLGDTQECPHDDIDGFITSAKAHGAGLSPIYAGFHLTCKMCGASWSGGANLNQMLPPDGDWTTVG